MDQAADKKRIFKPLKKGIISHQKQNIVEKNEKTNIVWRVLVTLKQYYKQLPNHASCWQREPVHQSLATID